MITYLLDTTICIYIIKKRPEQVIERLRHTRISEVGVSSITLSELEYGAAKSSRPAPVSYTHLTLPTTPYV